MYAIRNDRVMFVDVSYLCLENRHSDIRGSESLVELKKKTYANRRIAGKSRKWNRRRYIRRDPRVYRYRKSRLCLSAMDRICILTRERERERESRQSFDEGRVPLAVPSRSTCNPPVSQYRARDFRFAANLPSRYTSGVNGADGW